MGKKLQMRLISVLSKYETSHFLGEPFKNIFLCASMRFLELINFFEISLNEIFGENRSKDEKLFLKCSGTFFLTIRNNLFSSVKYCEL